MTHGPITGTTAITCPNCRMPLSLVRHVWPGLVHEYVVEHRVLSGNHFDAQTVVVRGTTKGVPAGRGLVDDPPYIGNAPTGKGRLLSQLAVEQVAAQFAGEVAAADLTARLTRERVVRAENIMGCVNPDCSRCAA